MNYSNERLKMDASCIENKDLHKLDVKKTTNIQKLEQFCWTLHLNQCNNIYASCYYKILQTSALSVSSGDMVLYSL